jgi:hypothetical protein
MIEEIDIYKNADYIEPTTIFAVEAAVSGTTLRHVQAFALTDSDDLYAYQDNGSGKIQLIEVSGASDDNPGGFTTVATQATNIHPRSDMSWHKWSAGTNGLYYASLSGSTTTLNVATTGGRGVSVPMEILVVSGGGGGGTSGSTAVGAGGGGGGGIYTGTVNIPQSCVIQFITDNADGLALANNDNDQDTKNGASVVVNIGSTAGEAIIVAGGGYGGATGDHVGGAGDYTPAGYVPVDSNSSGGGGDGDQPASTGGVGFKNGGKAGAADGGAGGGGGYVTNGFDGAVNTGGNGGQGYTSTITGSAVVYGSGGGGGVDATGTVGIGGTGAGNGGNDSGAATAGTGIGCGGGGGGDSSTNPTGGKGGPAAVIFRYLTTNLATQTGGTATTDGDYTVVTFLSSEGLEQTMEFTLNDGVESSVGVLDGIIAGTDHISMLRAFGELFITNGRYISKVDASGAFTQHAFTLPSDLIAIDMALRGDTIYILCEYGARGINACRVLTWDRVSTSQADETIQIPMAGAQWIKNHMETLRILCTKNGTTRIYEMPGLVPIKTHEIDDCIDESDLEAGIVNCSPTQTVFTKDGVLYFGLNRNDKTGLYALGRPFDGAPLALTLAKRCNTTDYTKHIIHTATSVGPNWFLTYDDDGTHKSMRIEENNSPTRSSNAIYESVWMDAGSLESVKDWKGVICTSKIIPTSCEIKIDAKVDGATTYDSNSLVTLTPSNDFTVTGGTADTYWHRIWTSLVGRMIKVRVRFTSSTTTKPTLYSVSVLSDARPII